MGLSRLENCGWDIAFFCSWLVGSDVGHVELWHDCTDMNARLQQKKTLELEGMGR